MKRIPYVSPLLLFLLYLLLPLCQMLGFVSGYDISFRNYTVMAALLALVSAAVMVRLFLNQVLGGNTCVEIQNNRKSFDFLIGKEDDNTLVINGKVYDINE